MFRNPANHALRVYRNALEIETVDDIDPFTLRASPEAGAVFHSQELGVEDRLDDVVARQAAAGALLVGFQCELLSPGGHHTLDSYQATVHEGEST